MDKAEIIARTLTQMNRTIVNQPPFSDEPDEEEFIVSVLQDMLPDGDIRICEDFRHLNVDCCQVCHEHPHYELSLIELQDGGRAWVCDAVKQALVSAVSSTRSAALGHRLRSSRILVGVLPVVLEFHGGA
jgi:hypothetical protein